MLDITIEAPVYRMEYRGFPMSRKGALMSETLIPTLIVGALVVLDVVTGVMKAAHAGDISSRSMREGLWHKSAYVVVIALAALIEYGERWLDLGYDVALMVPACVYIALTETVSILENTAAINPELRGSRIMELFKHGKDEHDK